MLGDAEYVFFLLLIGREAKSSPADTCAGKDPLVGSGMSFLHPCLTVRLGPGPPTEPCL